MLNKIYIYLSLLFWISSSTVYSVNIICGNCMRQDCQGNKCFIFTGEISGEYCSNSPTCSFTFEQNIQMGQCYEDLNKNVCSSGVCASKSTVPLCYQTANCPYTQKSTRTCSSSNMNWIKTITSPIPYYHNFNVSVPCYFTSQSEQYSSCASDFFGTSCNCCAKYQITGNSYAFGSCVHTDSPLAKVKLQLVNKAEKLTSIGLMLLLLLTVVLNP